MSNDKKNLGDAIREVVSLGAPAYPTQDEPKQEEKQQMTEPQDEFREPEPIKTKVAGTDQESRPGT